MAARLILDVDYSHQNKYSKFLSGYQSIKNVQFANPKLAYKALNDMTHSYRYVHQFQWNRTI